MVISRSVPRIVGAHSGVTAWVLRAFDSAAGARKVGMLVGWSLSTCLATSFSIRRRDATPNVRAGRMSASCAVRKLV
jgi:hypothetical protein